MRYFSIMLLATSRKANQIVSDTVRSQWKKFVHKGREFSFKLDPQFITTINIFAVVPIKLLIL
jgi:hypothetical protein